MATKLPYVLPFEDGAEVAAILLKAQGLPDAEQIATKTELQQATAYLATLDNATMAPQSATVKRTTDNLQAQINNIVRAPESGGDVGAEVYQARVGADGTDYPTLGSRLDANERSLDDVEAEVEAARVDVVGITHNTLKARIDSDYSTIKDEISAIDEIVNGEITETSLEVVYTTGIVKDVGGSIDTSNSTVYVSKKYNIPSGTTKVRIKTTAYDSDTYYKSDYYVYFANGMTVTGKYLSGYPNKTNVDVVIPVTAGSDNVWIVSRKKMNSGDTSEIGYLNECDALVHSGGLVDDVETVQTDVASLESEVERIDYTLLNLSEDVDVQQAVSISNGKYINDGTTGVNWTQHLSDDSSSQYTPSAYHFDSKYINQTLKITVTEYKATSGRFFGFCDENNIVVKAWRERDAAWVQNQDGTYTLATTILAPYLFLSFASSTVIVSITASFNLLEGKSKTGYVSPNGSDDNDGASMASAFQTVSKALEEGCERIMLAGGAYHQRINLSKSYGKHIDIVAFDRTSRPVFYEPDCVIVESATLDDGVYSATISASIESGNTWLYQDGVPDASTEITDAERLPLQRGKTCRLDDTRIVKCSAFALEDAIEEIKTSSGYKWFLNGTTLYFSAPSAPSESNPICMSTGRGLFRNANRSISISVSGIECKYIALNLNDLADVKATDCAATNIYGYGAITYDNTLNAQFLRCEASSCCNSTNGDGFNADVTNQGEYFSKHYTATFIDCWAHDNADDGYSDHRHAETTLFGGLFEYNGKAGVTPSYGCHCSCYSVYSRKNFSGFACVGPAQTAEGGKYTQLLCSNCVAENNTRGGQRAGFYVDGSGNRMILISCKAIGNTYSYTVGSSATAKLIDCGTAGQTTIIGGTPANATIENTTIVAGN